MRFFKVLLAMATLLSGTIATLSGAQALEMPEARHLLLRAGFGPEQPLLRQLEALSRGQAIDLLLDIQGGPVSPPQCLAETVVAQSQRKLWSDEQRLNYQQKLGACAGRLRLQYATHLLETRAVLHERMTLFWHNHFTSSAAKVRETALIYQQHRVLRSHALGNFRVLLHSILHDPAMRLYLDNVGNSQHSPNENLARELLELFTLGEGHYTEADVKEAARALSGYSVDRESFAARFYPKRHDYGHKRILGESGHFGLEGLAELLLQHPRTARSITRKVWLEFVSKPDETRIEALAKEFSRNWSIRRLVRGVLLSDAFWADQGSMIKSPVELVVGTARLLPAMQLPRDSIPPLLRQLGQDLFTPPNVKGWPNGKDWVDSSRLLARIGFSERLLRGLKRQSNADDMSFACSAGGPARLAALPPQTASDNSRPCHERLSAVLTDPVWQLK